MRQLPDEIDNLSSAEKLDLLDALWENLEAYSPTLTEEQEAELDSRVARYEQDPKRVTVNTRSDSAERGICDCL